MNRKQRRVAESQNKGNLNELLSKAITLHQAGNLDESETIYKNILCSEPDNGNALGMLGALQLQRGNIQESFRLLDQAVATVPQPQFYNYRGIALFNLGRYEDAVSSYDKAITHKPDYAEAYNNRGYALFHLKRYHDAIISYDRAIACAPGYAEACINRGLALFELKQYKEALASYNQAIAIRPGYAEAYSNRGRALDHLKQYEEALASFNQCIALKPGYPDAYNNRGLTLIRLKRQKEALGDYDHAIALNPRYTDAYINRGAALYDLAQYDAALADYNKAIAITPDSYDAYSNRGVIFDQFRQYSEAMSDYDKAIALNPGYAEAYSNRAFTFIKLNRYNDAIASYDRAIALDPNFADAYYNKSMLKLLLGEYKEAWQLYEWRWKKKDLIEHERVYEKPLWLGKEPLEGKTILFYGEQGLGDMLQFCRYVPMAAAQGAKIIFEVLPSMAGIVSALEGNPTIVIKGNPLPEFDYHAPLMSLPLAFGTTLETVPSAIYLNAEHEYVNKWKPVLDEKLGSKALRIGICWAGGVHSHDPDAMRRDAMRSMHFSQIKPLLDIENIAFVSLQLGPPKDQLDDKRVLDISSDLKNWSDTAAVVSLLDLVISVDTSVVHLAGAMGKKIWMFNRHDTCWRWLLDRDDSPWYPTLTQFRQSKPNDWKSVIERVGEELRIKLKP